MLHNNQGVTEYVKEEIKKCLHCGRCKNACPTGILRAEGTDCLSAITQRKGELSDSECELMRKYNTAWGCDVCQSVCPHNREPKITPIKFFTEERITDITSQLIDSMTEEEFSRRAFAWRGIKTVKRNTLILEQNKKTHFKKAENIAKTAKIL